MKLLEMIPSFPFYASASVGMVFLFYDFIDE